MLYIFIYKPKKKEIQEVLTYTQSLTKIKKINKNNTAPSIKNPYTTNTYPTYYKNIKST